MFQRSLNKLLRVLSGFRFTLSVVLLLLLSACGDSCYDDENIDDDGRSFYKKTYEHKVPASSAEWIDTGVNLEGGDTFTITDVQGEVSGCSNSNAVGSCAISYTTLCQSEKKYICNDSNCNSKTLINDCAGKSDCTPNNTCAASQSQKKCDSGTLYIYDSSSSKWVEHGNCMEAVSCDSSGNKILKTMYHTGSGQNITYYNVNHNIGKCSVNEVRCKDGHPYPVGAKTTTWTQIDSGILPGDDIYLKILPPKIGGAQMSATAAAVNNPSLNAWSSGANLRGDGGSSCPVVYPLRTAQSSYTGCKYLNQGYYTCPLCESKDSHRDTDGPIWRKCDNSGETLQCWYVGGSGMWLKMIDNSESCDASPGCSSGDSNCIWFDQYTGADLNNKFGTISYQPVNQDGNGCGQDMSKCSNRTTERHLLGPENQTSKMCVKFADLNAYQDNIGGYTVNVTRTQCVGKDGRQSKVADYWNKPGWYGLEYMISSTTPTPSEYGTSLPPAVQYPYTANIPQSGRLYLRVRDDSYSDNTGFYEVFLSYNEYFTGGAISGVIENIKNLIRGMTFGSATQFFHNITCVGDACNCQSGECRSQYLDYIRALLILYIAGYGLAFMIGFVEITQLDLFIRIMKIGVVMALISPGSFDFFYNDFFALFFEGMDDLIRKSQSGFNLTSSDGAVFSFVDGMISLTLLSKTTWLKILGLIVTSGYGLILGVLLIISILIFLIGIFKAVVVYLMATMVLGILMLLAPIFIPFMLFETTRHLFENWVRMFAQYALEPIILLIGLSFMTQLLYELFSDIINFHTCWKCMWPINMPFIPESVIKALGVTDTIFCIQFFGPFGLMPVGGALTSALGMGVADIIIVIILCHLILSYDGLVQQMVLRITGGSAAQFRVSGRLGDYNSAGSAVLGQIRSAEFRGVSIDRATRGFKEWAGRRARRGASRMLFGKTEEDKLLKQAKDLDTQHRLEISRRSNAFSKGFGNVIKNSEDEQKILRDPNESRDNKNVAAEVVGRKMYDSMGQTPEFESMMSNFSTLSSVDDGAKIHGELSGDAKKMHQVLKTENAKEALRTLSNNGASEDERRDATGRLFQTIHQQDPELHEMLHSDEPSGRDKLIKEVNDLERTPRDALKAQKDDGEGDDE